MAALYSAECYQSPPNPCHQFNVSGTFNYGN